MKKIIFFNSHEKSFSVYYVHAFYFLQHQETFRSLKRCEYPEGKSLQKVK